MEADKTGTGFEKPVVDEEYLMDIISGDEPVAKPRVTKPSAKANEAGPKDKQRAGSKKAISYEELFLTNRYPSGRNGKVVYIRPEFHERLLRIVQLTREEKTTLYSYIDNILEHHFKEFGTDILDFYNERNKPIL